MVSARFGSIAVSEGFDVLIMSRYSHREIMNRRLNKLNGLEEPDKADQQELEYLGRKYIAG